MSRRHRRLSGVLLSLVLTVCPAWVARAHHAEQHRMPIELQEIGYDQRLHERVPADLVFRDSAGKHVRLGEYFGGRPVILSLAYYECPMLCPLVLDGVLRSLRTLSLDLGRDYTVITVSIDPGETPQLAAATKARMVRAYGRPGAAAGWHFLTGEAAAIRRLSQAVGFRYTYDPAKDQYAHAAGIVVLAPQGTIARYLYGIEFAPRDLRLSLVQAAAGTIGSPVDQLLLLCYQYDPTSGTYTVAIMNVLRLAGIGTALGLGGLMVILFRRERMRSGAPDRQEQQTES